MTMNPELEKAIRKVAHLRALAASTTSPKEAEAAAAQAAAIMAKYQIDEVLVEQNNQEVAEEIGEGDPLWTGGRDKSWMNILCGGLSKIHGCHAIVSRSCLDSTISYRIAGRPSDMAIVRYLFSWLTVEIMRLSHTEDGRAARNAFRLGAAQGVLDAIRKARNAEIGSAPQSAAMARGWIEAQVGRIRAATKITFSDTSGAQARGYARGQGLAPKVALGSAPGAHKALGRGNN